jgi:IMP dehydrogenase/GMP reductase
MKISPSIELDVPVIAAQMDSVCDRNMVESMNDEGATGFLHRFMDIEEHIRELSRIDNGPVVGVVGVTDSSKKRVESMEQFSLVDAICIDTAHAHLEKCIDMVEYVDDETDSDIIVGNVATYDGANDLFNAGADTVKIGVGPGGACTTRKKTGVGVPQISAIHEASIAANDDDKYLIADGGMKTPGDVAKSIMAGADAAMLGSYFASCQEAPMDGVIRGMASSEAQQDHSKSGVSEGGVKSVEVGESVSDKVSELAEGLASASSYCGSESLTTARDNAEFIRVSNSASDKSGLH